MIRKIIFLIVCAFYFQTNAQATENYMDRVEHVINISPHVEITNFRYGNTNKERGGSRMEMHAEWKNITTQPIIAFEIVVLKYDAFNTRMMGSKWVVTGKNSADWSNLNPGESSGDGILGYREEEVFTAIAYVRQARLKDGTVWRVSEADLQKELKKVAPKFIDFGSLKPDENRKDKKD